MKFRLGYGWLLVGGQVWLPGAIWGWWPGECLFFFFWNLLRSAQNLLRAIPYFINERVMHTNYIGRYDQSTWGEKEHMWNDWICNCLATARFCLTRKNDNVCGRAILSVDAIGIAFNWLKVRCWLLGGGAGFEGVDISFFSNVRRRCIDHLLSYT